jgi:hypothetical protein
LFGRFQIDTESLDSLLFVIALSDLFTCGYSRLQCTCCEEMHESYRRRIAIPGLTAWVTKSIETLLHTAITCRRTLYLLLIRLQIVIKLRSIISKKLRHVVQLCDTFPLPPAKKGKIGALRPNNETSLSSKFRPISEIPIIKFNTLWSS